MRITSERHYAFDVTPDELWATFQRTDRYQQWWPWLTHFESGGLAAQQCWVCRVQPPVPYAVSFRLFLTDVVDERLAAASIDGDISGWARIEIAPTTRGCEVQLHSELAPSNPILRTVAFAARPMVTFGHDWVLDSGCRQFRAHALSATDQRRRRRDRARDDPEREARSALHPRHPPV